MNGTNRVHLVARLGRRPTSSSCGRCGTRSGSACCEGDQLPTVKDVVAGLAINPNTVLKAYRELEHEGLVSARPGLGTFVTRTLANASLAAHGPLRAELERWLTEGTALRVQRREHRGALRVHLRCRRARADSASAPSHCGPRPA